MLKTDSPETKETQNPEVKPRPKEERDYREERKKFFSQFKIEERKVTGLEKMLDEKFYKILECHIYNKENDEMDLKHVSSSSMLPKPKPKKDDFADRFDINGRK